MARQPIIPANLGDPNGTDAKVRQAITDFKRRIRLCRKAYLDLLDRIEFDTVTTNAIAYEFRILPNVLAQLLDETARLVDTLLGADVLRSWFVQSYVVPAYEKGAAAAWRNLGAQSTEYQALRPTLISLFQSGPYQSRIGLIAAREFELMKGLSANVKQGLSQQLTAGLVQGLGPKRIAENITAQTGIEERRAERIARTEINQALRTARLDESRDAATRLGIQLKVMHLSALSPTTRPSHAARSGQLFTVQEEQDWYSEGSNAINCYLPGTKVRGRFVAGSKARYQGPTVNLMAADGSNLTVTPNHPVMTQRGLIAAAEVAKADYLLTYRDQVKDPSRVAALDREAINPEIQEVFRALSDVGHPLPARVNAVDFHGDARFMDKNVNIVRADRVLPCAVDVECAQAIDDVAFEHANSVFGSSERPQGLAFRRIDLAPSGLLGRPGISLSLLGCHLGRPAQGSFAAVPLNEPRRLEAPANDDSRKSDFPTKLLDRLAGKVAFVQVENIEFGHFDGHVYDLEEVSGLMIANGIIASNCKCSQTEVLVDENGQPRSPGLVDRVQAASDRWLEKNAE